VSDSPMPAPAEGAPYRPEPSRASPAPGGPYRSALEAEPPAAPPRPNAGRAALVAMGLVVLVLEIGLFGPDGIASGGLGVAFVFLAVPPLLFFGARRRRASPRLAALAAGLALLALRAILLPTPLTVLLGFGLLFAFAVALRAPRSGLPRLLRAAQRTAVAAPLRWVDAARALWTRRPRNARASSAALVVLVPAAASAGFVAIFGLANPVVGEALEALWMATPSSGRSITFARVLCWGLAGLLAVLLVRPSVPAGPGADAHDGPARASNHARHLARATLASLNAVFAAYLVLEATYGFGALPPAGYAPQTYAHDGAFWLTVALLLLTLVHGVIFHGALARDPREAWLRRLGYLWIGQGLVLAVGTYTRLGVHIQHSGLSDLRIVGVLGTTLVVIGVLLVAARLRAGRSLDWLIRRQLDALMVVSVLYAVAPTHALSATFNVARIGAGEVRPLILLPAQARQTESVASLLPLLDHPDPTIARGVAVLLRSEGNALKATLRRRDGWAAQDVLTAPVAAALDRAGPRIEALVDEVEGVQPLRELERRGYGAMGSW
jgi:hypothetical protein